MLNPYELGPEFYLERYHVAPEYVCDGCGSEWYNEFPRIIECGHCGERMCPMCKPRKCDCGAEFCSTRCIRQHEAQFEECGPEPMTLEVAA